MTYIIWIGEISPLTEFNERSKKSILNSVSEMKKNKLTKLMVVI